MKSIRLLFLLGISFCSFCASHGQKEVRRQANALEKIKRIEIPGINFFETPFDKALNTLQAYSRKNDLAESDPARKGVNIITLAPEGDVIPKLTVKLNKMSLEQMLDFTTEMVDWTYQVREDAIVVSKEGGVSAKPRRLEIDFFEVAQGTINRMTGGVAANVGGPPDPFGRGAGGGAAPNDQAGKIKHFLMDAGVEFDEAAGHKFVFDGFQIIATHEQESLDRIRAILHNVDPTVPRQINVNFKIVEAPLGALDQAMLKAVGEDRQNVAQTMQIENRWADKVFLELNKSEDVELKSLPRLVAMDGQPSSLTIGEEMIYPTDFKESKPPANPTTGKTAVANAPVPQFDTVAPDDEPPGFRLVGIKIDLTPRYESQYDLINLELAPKITELKGFEEYGTGIKVPKFWSWKLITSVKLRRNHTMIFRGPASDQKREIVIFLQANAFR